MVTHCVRSEDALSGGFTLAGGAEAETRALWLSFATGLYLTTGTDELQRAILEGRSRCLAYAVAAALTEQLRSDELRTETPALASFSERVRERAEASRAFALEQIGVVRQLAIAILRGWEATP